MHQIERVPEVTYVALVLKRPFLKRFAQIAVVEGNVSGLAPEHILARLADLTDAGISLVRLFRP